MHHWVITHDLNTDPDQDQDLSGSYFSGGSVRLTAGQIWTHVEGREFRLVDSDETVLFVGIYVGEEKERQAPLETFGMQHDGCMDIHYKNDRGDWSRL